MITDPSQIDVSEVRCQICIVGSGAAGITLALELGRQRFDLALIAGGGHEQSAADEALYRGTIDRPGAHEPLEENRHRAFGGSTKRWGGRLVPFDPIDFEQRDFVPLSGWPIDYEEVAKYYPGATSLCEVEPNEYQLPPSRNGFDLPATLGDDSIETTPCERWSPPTDFAVRYRSELEAMDNVRVLIDYHATNIRLSEDRQSVSEIVIHSREGRPLRVTAEVFILATGGIENARLLLASQSQIDAGVGNHSDMVGRCYMSHVAGTFGRLRLKERAFPEFYRWQFDPHGAYCRRRFQLAAKTQRELNVMNVIGFPFRPDPADLSHRDAVMSMLYLHDALGSPGGERPSWRQLSQHAANMLFNSPAAWLSIVRQIRQRTMQPRLPIVLPHNRRAQDALFFQGEHAPNRESRLMLSDERDEFGMPRVTPHVGFVDIDLQTIKVFYRVLDQGLRAAGVGELEYDAKGLDDYLNRQITNFGSMAHHLGTTRMSADPQQGVVDEDCKVHSLRNFYICGSSVFPTSGHANPTLVILAMTLRLADHLIGRLSSNCVQSNVSREAHEMK